MDIQWLCYKRDIFFVIVGGVVSCNYEDIVLKYAVTVSTHIA